ncbi:hypothetical protein BD779DRAFT_1672189 [Infundibulicybe gibba]|nr:hypothetical protein BD779DRAFT_1672189 [Infundibulicybe gibba]
MAPRWTVLSVSVLSDLRLSIDASYLNALLTIPPSCKPLLTATGGLPLALTQCGIKADLRALKRLHVKPVFLSLIRTHCNPCRTPLSHALSHSHNLIACPSGLGRHAMSVATTHRHVTRMSTLSLPLFHPGLAHPHPVSPLYPGSPSCSRIAASAVVLISSAYVSALPVSVTPTLIESPAPLRSAMPSHSQHRCTLTLNPTPP